MWNPWGVYIMWSFFWVVMTMGLTPTAAWFFDNVWPKWKTVLERS